MTDEEKALDLWAKEWKLCGASLVSKNSTQVGVDMSDWREESWLGTPMVHVLGPHQNRIGERDYWRVAYWTPGNGWNDKFFRDVHEALDFASEKLRDDS